MRGFGASQNPRLRSVPSSAFVVPRGGASLLPAAAAIAALLWGCATAGKAPAPREGFPLDPREGLAGPFDASIESGWRAIESGDAQRARREFGRAVDGASRRVATIGSIEALVLAERWDDAAPLCERALADGQGTLALWTACGERAAGAGDPTAAYELYQHATDRAPQRRGVARRTRELRDLATDAILASAEREATEGKRAEARAKVAQALVWNPGAAPVLARAAEVECAAGEKETAMRYYRDALALGGLEERAEQRAGELALETGDYATAVTVFESLASRDPALRERAAEARLAFRIDNWPDAERQAARTRRLTRAGAAQLVSWMFPELREARVRSGVVAGDVLERRDSRVMMRAIAFGLLDVDPETHRARPDAPLTRGAAAQMLLRLSPVLARPVPPAGCLAQSADAQRSGPEAIRLAARCGLLSESGGTYVGGPEMTRGLDRLRSLFALGEADRRD